MVIQGQKLVVDEKNILTCSKEMETSGNNLLSMSRELADIHDAMLREIEGEFKNSLYYAQETTESIIQNVSGQFKSLSSVLLQYSANNMAINQQAELSAR